MRALVAWAGLIVGGGAAVVFMACSGGNAGNGGDAGGGDAAGEAATPLVDAAPPADAGPDIQQDPNIYPSQHQPIPQLQKLGGPVLSQMKLVTISFKSGPDGGADPFAGAVHQLGDLLIKSDYWHKAMAGYNVGDGASNTYVELQDTVSHKGLSDSDVQALVQTEAAAGHLPTPDAQTLYAIYFPSTATVSNGPVLGCPTLGAGFGGYHDSMQVVLEGGTYPVAYAVILECQVGTQLDNLNFVTRAASHEIAEAATDPLPSTTPTFQMTEDDAWISALAGGSNENGDLCVGAPSWDESGYAVQPIYSNAAAADSNEPCQPSDPTRIYFNAAVRTTLQSVSTSHKSKGYAILKPGQSQDLLVDVFSRAKLPHALKLYVGRTKRDFFGNGPTDPTDLAAIEDAITATLSVTTVNNGDGAILTVNVPKSAVAGDFPFVVRAVLETNDWHEWPMLIHVP